jgi:hypothetical protein
MQSQDAGRINQDISTALIDIPFRFFEPVTASEFFKIGHPSARPPYFPETSIQHVVGAVDFTAFIDQDWELVVGLFSVTASQIACLKGYNHYLDIYLLELILVLLQLQQMTAAWQSAQVAMKDHQKPLPLVVFKTMDLVLNIRQLKGKGCLSHFIFYHNFPLLIS